MADKTLPRTGRDWGEDLNRRGREAENRFANICESYTGRKRLPSLLRGITRATRWEDSRGADFFAETTEGIHIPIDIKASEGALEHFLKKLRKKGRSHDHVIFLVVSPRKTKEAIWAEAVEKILAKRQAFLAKRAAAE